MDSHKFCCSCQFNRKVDKNGYCVKCRASIRLRKNIIRKILKGQN